VFAKGINYAEAAEGLGEIANVGDASVGPNAFSLAPRIVKFPAGVILADQEKSHSPNQPDIRSSRKLPSRSVTDCSGSAADRYFRR
jgi:hypothetical protein